MNIFHVLEVVDRVSETQIQVGGNSNYLIWWLCVKYKEYKKSNVWKALSEIESKCLK